MCMAHYDAILLQSDYYFVQKNITGSLNKLAVNWIVGRNKFISRKIFKLFSPCGQMANMSSTVCTSTRPSVCESFTVRGSV